MCSGRHFRLSCRSGGQFEALPAEGAACECEEAVDAVAAVLGEVLGFLPDRPQRALEAPRVEGHQL